MEHTVGSQSDTSMSRRDTTVTATRMTRGRITTVIDDASAKRSWSTPLAWLTTVRADGQPQTSYIWFHYDGEDIVLLSQPNTPKLRNIASNPRVSFNLDGDTATGGGVLTIEATAEISRMRSDRQASYLAKYESRIRKGPWGTPDAFVASYSTAIRIAPARVTRLVAGPAAFGDRPVRAGVRGTPNLRRAVGRDYEFPDRLSTVVDECSIDLGFSARATLSERHRRDDLTA